MDLREISEIGLGGGTSEKKKEKGVVPTTSSEGGEGDGNGREVDAGMALQSLLDRIPITSIPNLLSSSPVVEITSDDCILHAIGLLYRSNLIGAPIVDNINLESKKFINHEIGFIEFSGMVFWSLEELDRVEAEAAKECSHGYLSALELNPQIGMTKISELAKQLLWEPFFPVHADESLFHAMLLFSKHPRLNVIPVIGSSNSQVAGFIIQHAVVQLLLQSAGLDWFDQIADEPGFKNASEVVLLYSDQSVSEAFHVMWQKHSYAAPVIDRKSRSLVGFVRQNDVHLLLEDDSLFSKRKETSIGEFIQVPGAKKSIQTSRGSADNNKLPSSVSLSLKNSILPPMNRAVTNHKSDSLRSVMENLVSSNGECSFLLNNNGQVEGMVTLRDIISPFSPPSMDSRIGGGGFFESALQQAGCHIKDGTVVKT